MRRLLLTAAAVVGFSAVAHAQDADFILINNTGYDLREVYVSQSHKESWGSDRLGSTVLSNGGSRTFRFPKSGAQCVQDLKVVYDDDGSSAIWREINLCEVEKIRIRYNRSNDTTSASFE